MLAIGVAELELSIDLPTGCILTQEADDEQQFAPKPLHGPHADEGGQEVHNVGYADQPDSLAGRKASQLENRGAVVSGNYGAINNINIKVIYGICLKIR